MRVYCDFDGTITTADTTDHVLGRLADPSWREIEADWVAGRIDAAECMRRQLALVRASDAELDAAIDELEITRGFYDFAAWCAVRRVPLVVVSDGVDYFIRRILARHGLAYVPVVANHLAGDARARRLEQPWRNSGCAAGSGVCKCAVARSDDPRQVVFIGDGRSDFCVSRRVDVLFAKAALARHAEQQGINFLPFEDFHDVLQRLAPLADDGDHVVERLRQRINTKEYELVATKT